MPSEAVKTRHGVDYISLATADGAMDVAVVLGETVEHGDGQRVEILTGLRDGDKVVIP